jgi:hypothetical protein
LCLLAGCGTQQVLLGTEGDTLLTVHDVLCRPGEAVELRADLSGGDLLTGKVGRVVLYRRGGRLFAAAETNLDGTARVEYTPETPGDTLVEVGVDEAGLAGPPPRPQVLRIAARHGEEPIAIVDLDKTVVASGFHTVLIGDPEPMAGSAEVLTALAEDHTIVYLTHRPSYFGPKSKSWLAENGYPPGPVLLSSVGGFLKGSGSYKTAVLADLRERFENIRVGIGDKISDAAAYHENGMEAFLIVQIDESQSLEDLRELHEGLEDLPHAVHVVTDWGQVAAGLDGREGPSPSQVRQRLEEIIRRREAEKLAREDAP